MNAETLQHGVKALISKRCRLASPRQTSDQAVSD
ncbi:hypothetical protein VCHC17A1_2416A, partial [Vibrio cholerae HC-17A1]